MLIRTIIFLLMFSISSINLNAAQYIPPQVGDYLVAKISSDSNDYSTTKRYYQRLHRSNPNDLLALDIKYALNHLGEITGEVTNDEILGNIFSKFCIGK